MHSKNIIRIIALVLWGAWGSASAQNDDFGLDFSLEAEKRLCKGVGLSLEAEARTQDNTRKIERWTAGGTLGLRLYRTKQFSLKASAGWKYMWRYNLPETTTKSNGYNTVEGTWRNRHRTSLSLAAAYNPNKRWHFQLKETFQYTHFGEASATKYKYRETNSADTGMQLVLDDTETKTYKAKDKTVLRSKLAAQYDIRHSKFDPYASVDYGCGLNYTTNKWKFTLGTDYKLTKQSRLNIFYRYITEDDDEDPNGHLVGVGYSFKF